jgi:hypothetical protein
VTEVGGHWDDWFLGFARSGSSLELEPWLGLERQVAS